MIDDDIPWVWRQHFKYCTALFDGISPSPFADFTLPKKYRQPISFQWEVDPAVRATISNTSNKFTVKITTGSYITIHHIANLVLRNRDVINNLSSTANRDSLSQSILIDGDDVARAIAEVRKRELSFSDLKSAIKDIHWRHGPFELPVLPTQWGHSGSDNITSFALYFMLCHEFGHFWNGHFAFKRDRKLIDDFFARAGHKDEARLWKALEQAADSWAAMTLADFILSDSTITDKAQPDRAAFFERATVRGLTGLMILFDLIGVGEQGKSVHPSYDSVMDRMNTAIVSFGAHVRSCEPDLARAFEDRVTKSALLLFRLAHPNRKEVGWVGDGKVTGDLVDHRTTVYAERVFDTEKLTETLIHNLDSPAIHPVLKFVFRNRK